MAAVFLLLGAALIVAGATALCPPAGLIVAGILLVATGIDLTGPSRTAKPAAERDRTVG